MIPHDRGVRLPARTPVSMCGMISALFPQRITLSQIEIANNTPYRRRVFLLSVEAQVTKPVPLMLTAWKHFDLDPGESRGTAVTSLRLGIRIAEGSALDHRTVAADVNLGDRWSVEMKDGIPVLTSGRAISPGSIEVFNGLSGAEAAFVTVTIYRDYAPWASFQVMPGFTQLYQPTQRLSVFASTPVGGDDAPLVLEPAVASVILSGEDTQLSITPSADGSSIQWTNGVQQ